MNSARDNLETDYRRKECIIGWNFIGKFLKPSSKIIIPPNLNNHRTTINDWKSLKGRREKFPPLKNWNIPIDLPSWRISRDNKHFGINRVRGIWVIRGKSEFFHACNTDLSPSLIHRLRSTDYDAFFFFFFFTWQIRNPSSWMAKNGEERKKMELKVS